MFKELKSTLGLAQYQFRSFVKVERFVAACLVTFLYLEWWRWRRLTARNAPAAERKRCAEQRTHGLCRLVRLRADLNDLHYLSRGCRTKTGIRRLRQTLTRALPTEYQITV